MAGTGSPSEPPDNSDVHKESALDQVDKAPERFWRAPKFYYVAIGTLVGAIAMIAASTTRTAQTGLNDWQSYLALQMADLPLGGDILEELFGNFTMHWKPAPLTDYPFEPALSHQDTLDLKPHFPVVMIPGIVSSGLESWGTHEKSRKYFRKRMWGTTTMFRSVLLDKESWTDHLMLDPKTGLDPKNIKLRVAQGLDSADYFVTGYWVWAKIIENLAAIGYDSNTMHLAAYDWRLSYSNLEVRDQYFSHLKAKMELTRLATGRKSVVLAHSMGANLFPYFLKWVESPIGGNGGSDWTENHVETFVNIGGPMVGVPKAMTLMLSGETRDTMALGSLGAYILEKFFSRRERVNLMRTWAGGSSMLPKGGDTIWGDHQRAPDDDKSEKFHTFGNMISFVPPRQGLNENSTDDSSQEDDFLFSNHTVDMAFQLLHQSSTPEYVDQLRYNYSFGLTTSPKQLDKNEHDPTKWTNPLESRLPHAPSMKIYCFYGVGLPTERSYYYASTHPGNNDHVQNETSFAYPLFIDPNVNDPIQRIETGVRFGDGDGTVPLLSLGYMCAPQGGGWTKHAHLYNPGRSPVVLKEYLNEAPDSRLEVRGGKKAADHVDILGNWEMTLDILQIVSNGGGNVTERIHSKINDYALHVDLS